MQSNATSSSPPIGARRVKTDLHTSEKLYVHSVGRSRSNSPMHAGGFTTTTAGRHGLLTHHRKAASEPKGPVSTSTTTTTTAAAYLTVPHTVNAAVPSRQRSSSTGAPASRTSAAAHHRLLVPSGTAGSTSTLERCASVRLGTTSPSRAGDHHHHSAAGTTGIANRSQLPARARLLTRRLQNNATPTNGSESPRSIDSLPRRTFAGSYKTATLSQFHNLANNNNNNNCTDSASTATNSAEDLTLLDKSLRNSMLQDVVHFKKQLVRLRRIMQELRPVSFGGQEGLGRTFMRHFPTRPLYVADYFPISHSSVGFELALAARCANHCRVAVARIAVLANRLLTIIADLFNRLLLTRLSRRVANDGGAAMMARWARNCLDGASAPFVLVRDVLQKLYSMLGQVLLCDIVLAIGMLCAINLICILHLVHSRLDTCPAASAANGLPSLPDRMTIGLPYAPRSEKPVTPKNGLRTPSAVGLAGATPPHQHHHHTNGTPTTPKSKTQISSVYTQLSSVRHSYAGNGSAPTTPTHNAGAQNGLRRTSLGSSHNLSTFGLHSPSERSPHGSNKPVRTTQIGTLASPIQRQPPNGTTVKPPPSKAVPPSRTNGVVNASKLNGLNGAAKRTAAGTTTGSSSIIRPPSSFGSSSSLASVGEPLKSKSAPLVVVPNGKLLTPAATGAATSDEREPSGSESDKDTVVVNGGAIGTAGSCCSEENNLASAGNTNGSTVNGIVGH
uniref:Uncharacterized protein n=1 Tax=Anopheles melas TaxID=34690 RepID=A0A182UHJ1_9DIPT